MSAFSFVVAEASLQGIKEVDVSEFSVTLISKSFTKTGVESFASPVFSVPGISVQDIDANKGSTPSDFTTIEYVLPCVNSISDITDCNPFLVIVSAAFLVFINPQPETASGPTVPKSSAV